MKKNLGSRIAVVVYAIIIIISLTILFNVYKTNYINGFKRGEYSPGISTITRDRNIKCSDMDSYKIESPDYNDALFFKEIEVEPNTPYRVTCMVKTENVVSDTEKVEAGAMICIYESNEVSDTIQGTNDWQELEFYFISRDREKVSIAFRLGGNEGNCTGTAWFSDFKVESGLDSSTDTEWNIGCFILTSLDLNINSKNVKMKMDLNDVENAKANMERFASSCNKLSEGKMTVKHDTYVISDPITTISHSEEHDYYIDMNDVKELIWDTVKEKEYDHVFLVAKMENSDGEDLPRGETDWIGLGGMSFQGVGYSNVRLFEGDNGTYAYNSMSNTFPEEVYIHEFLHDLERTMADNGYYVPDLHDYEKYGYKISRVNNLEEWYRDYMSKKIYDEDSKTYIGLDSKVYELQPIHSDNFEYSLELNFNHEPQNIIEEINSIFKAVKEVIERK